VRAREKGGEVGTRVDGGSVATSGSESWDSWLGSSSVVTLFPLKGVSKISACFLVRLPLRAVLPSSVLLWLSCFLEGRIKDSQHAFCYVCR
jgi:hypothetical protein